MEAPEKIPEPPLPLGTASLPPLSPFVSLRPSCGCLCDRATATTPVRSGATTTSAKPSSSPCSSCGCSSLQHSSAIFSAAPSTGAIRLAFSSSSPSFSASPSRPASANAANRSTKHSQKILLSAKGASDGLQKTASKKNFGASKKSCGASLFYCGASLFFCGGSSAFNSLENLTLNQCLRIVRRLLTNFCSRLKCISKRVTLVTPVTPSKSG